MVRYLVSASNLSLEITGAMYSCVIFVSGHQLCRPMATELKLELGTNDIELIALALTLARLILHASLDTLHKSFSLNVWWKSACLPYPFRYSAVGLFCTRITFSYVFTANWQTWFQTTANHYIHSGIHAPFNQCGGSVQTIPPMVISCNPLNTEQNRC